LNFSQKGEKKVKQVKIFQNRKKYFIFGLGLFEMAEKKKK